ncbi:MULTISPECIES: TonB-dependent receptor [unclassified Iodidimonas]|jgi:TonB-dependent receptor|uniref:TonB-dependent receptor n=1 Tax=unclassified Iodidimonas TaxID=2626145 RepID=UPI002482D875|nr:MULTISPECIES: TonB-dependent receptor [unclassified Iodidimonas]
MTQKATDAPRSRRFFTSMTSRFALLSMLASAPAMAQGSGTSAEDEPFEIDEIVVTGIRGSLNRAMDIKRNSDRIVDSISSENLGKFPDSNVAESLQRISGVSIDRSGGEGQFVTVRGFGPSFNTVLVNGRSFATENQGREFSFDLLAADLITGADVYKSSVATTQTGALGATINVKTARPLDIGGFKFVASAKGMYEDLSERVQPQGFAFISDTFMDDRLGLLLSISHQSRDAQIDSVETRGFNPNSSLPQAGLEGVFVPQNFDQITNFENRDRTGVTGVIEYKATDRLHFTVDALWNRFKVKSNAASIGHWFTADQILDAEIDSNRTVTNLTHSENGATDFISRTFNRPTKIKALGFNADWQLNDMINLVFDSSWSRATSNNGGNDSFAVIGFNNGVSFSNDGTTDLPSVTGLPANLQDPSIGRAHIAIREGWDVTDEIFENRLDSAWEVDGEHLKRLKIGAYYADRTKTNELVRTDPNTLCLFCGYFVDVPDSILRPFENSGFLAGFSGDIPRAFQTFDPDDLFAFLESPEAATARDTLLNLAPGTTASLIGPNGFSAQVQPDSFRVNEIVADAYIEADIEGEVAGLPWFVNLGARYTHTNLTATGSQLTLNDLRTVFGDETIFQGVFAGGVETVRQSNSYDKFLPSLNAKIEFTDEIIGRFAASKTVTRPQLTDLAPRVNFDVLRPGNLIASGGNPDLKPFTSDNFDLSFEYYYAPGGYFTVALYYKQIDDFIVSTLAVEDFPVDNADNIFPGGLAPFNVRRPRNFESANVRGVEIAFQHLFDYLPGVLSGFGVTANATFVASNADVDQGSINQTFALEGLGNSQNFILFYDKGGFESRIAYNRRGEFLQTVSNPVGGDPIFVKTFDQIDARASFAITPNVSVFVEGINITNEKVFKTGRFDNQLLQVVNTGARYAFGVRTEF